MRTSRVALGAVVALALAQNSGTQAASVTVTLNEYYDCDPGAGMKCIPVGEYLRYSEPSGEFRLDITNNVNTGPIRTTRISGRGRKISAYPDLNIHFTLNRPSTTANNKAASN